MTFSSASMGTMKKLNEDRKTNQLCDVAISVKSKVSDSFKVYHAHKCVLAVESSHLRNILHKDTDLIQIPIDSDLHIFEAVLDFIYSGEINLDAENCASIRCLANHLGIDKLVDLCKHYYKLYQSERGDDVLNVVVVLNTVDENLETNQQADKKQRHMDLTANSQGSISSSFTPASETRRKTWELVMYICDVCKKRFMRKSHLSRHMSAHCGRGRRKLCCATCGKLFQMPSKLARHEQTHSTVRPFQCSACGKTFKTKGGLRSHEWTHDAVRPFFCEICAKQFKFKSTLLLHQKTHVLGSFRCQYCEKTFTNEVRFLAHVSMHTNPPSCKTCGKNFRFRAQLLRHEMIHTGDRSSFSCETCGKQFCDINGLNLHKKRHTGVGMHECPKCDKKFVSKFHLRRHARVHTGEKPFQCNHCNRSFTRADNCRSHQLTCGLRYATADNNQSSAKPQVKE